MLLIHTALRPARVSVATVESHMHSIHGELAASSRAAAVHRVRLLGWLERSRGGCVAVPVHVS